jgi:addiction module HigA family antidote
MEEITMRIRSHPGYILNEEFMSPLGLSSRRLGDAIGVPGNRISDIIRGRRDVSADTAIRLGRFFGTSSEFWMNLQAAHALSKATAEHDYRDITHIAAS